MPSDKTRTSDDIRLGYKGPVMQQGRVILDRDFNALQETLSAAIEADALDIVGPCGTPDDGFAISIPGISSPPDPGLWVPPAPLVAPAPHPFDFLISPGTMYVGGQRGVFPAADPGQQPFTYSYFDQPDWIQPDDPSGGSPVASPQVEFIYLHLFEQEVSAVEDSDLKDVALGGPDTTQRLRLIRRVERLPVAAGDCASALAQAQGVWLERGLQFDPPTMQLLPQAALQVGFTQSATAADPCDPVATGGYLGADNQLVRVQICDAGDGTAGSGKLLWGYDNASFLYRVTVNPDSKTLQLNQSPVDAFHSPKSGQFVEVLRTAAILESDPDASDPFHQQTIVRCIAEASAEVRTLAAGYDPAAGTVVLDQVLPAEYLDDAVPVFLRIWQAELGFDPAGGTVELADAGGVTTGVQVTITIPTNGIPPVGAYWMIAVRPSTPQAVYPERFLISPQPPDGPRQWACPLAVIDWTKAAGSSPPADELAVQDCREKFDNLVDLTKRKLGGCCLVTIRPEDVLADPGALQTGIDKVAGAADGTAVCLTPGTYALTQPLRLDARHSGLTVEACHGAVTLKAAADADLTQFLDGLIVVSGANHVTLHGLSLELPAVPLAEALELIGTSETDLQALIGTLNDPRAMIGLRLQDCTDLTVEECRLLVTPPPDFGVFAAGMFAGGDCTGLTVQGTQFIGPARVAPAISVAAPVAPTPSVVAPIAPVEEVRREVVEEKTAKSKKRKVRKQQVISEPAPSRAAAGAVAPTVIGSGVLGTGVVGTGTVAPGAAGTGIAGTGAVVAGAIGTTIGTGVIGTVVGTEVIPIPPLFSALTGFLMVPSIDAISAGWTQAAPVDIDHYGGFMDSDDAFAYEGGGYSFSVGDNINEFGRFDPVANIWMALAPVPDLNNAMASAVYAPNVNKLFVFGGERVSTATVVNTTRIYDFAANTWAFGPPMPDVRAFMGSGYYNGKIYLVGGYTTGNVDPSFGQVWEYDPVANTWNTSRASMPITLGGPGFGIINGHIYIAGGRNINNTNLNTLYDYDIVADYWTQRANLPTGINVPGSAVIGGNLWVFGGGDSFEGSAAMPLAGKQGVGVPDTTNILQIYDPATNTWTGGPPLNQVRSFPAGTDVGNTAVAVGGYTGTGTTTSVEITVSGSVPQLRARAVLDRAAFRLNRLQGLTVAVLSAADSGAIRFQDNTVTDCFGGVWFDSLALTDVSGAEEFEQILTQLENGNTNIASALQLAMFYPAPQALGARLLALRPRVLPLAATSARQPVNAKKVRVFSLLSPSLQTVDSLKLLSLSAGVALSPQFHVTNNQIDALPGDGSSSGLALLLLAGFGGNRDLQPDAASSVLVSANEFRNRGPAFVDFTVLIFGATSNSLTANIILNETPPDPNANPPVNPVSLFILPGPGENGAMAATGNVLNCTSNLDNFQRSDIQSFPTDTVPELAQLNNWKFLNFEPLPPQPQPLPPQPQ